MREVPLNKGWRVRPRTGGPFQQLQAGEQGWEEVTLPHDAMLGRGRDPEGEPTLAFFRPGEIEYERRLDVPLDWEGQRVLVRFDGVYRDAVVLLNGETIASRPYGYTDFVVRLDDRLRFDAQNVLRVECRTTRFDNRWYTGAGIHREVSLFVGPPTHLVPDGVVVTTPDVAADGAVVVVDATIANDTGAMMELRVRCDIVDANGTLCASDDQPVTVGAGSQVTARTGVVLLEPRLWDVEDPHLYTCRVAIHDGTDVIDEATTSFGIRTVTVDARRGLRLNGQPLKLRGACVHADNGVIGAAAIGRADERRVELLKAAGFNAVRSAHHPMSRAMLEACDRHGVVVVDEAFDTWGMRKREDDYSRYFQNWWCADLEAMVAKDRNHPSVIMYSIGNEILEIGSTTGSLLSRQLADHVRHLDPTRPVTNGVSLLFTAAHGVGWDPGTLLNAAYSGNIEEISSSEQVTNATEEAFAALDVAGYNYARFRYRADGERFPNRVILGTETFPSQIDLFWRAVLDNDHVIGDFTWTGWDYLGEVGIGRVVHDTDDGAEYERDELMGTYPWRYAWCGDIDVTGVRLPVSYYREIVFGLRTEPYIVVTPPSHHGAKRIHASEWAWGTAIGSWTWDGGEGRPVTVDVYADADEVELIQDGASLGRQPSGSEHRFTSTFTTTYWPGELLALAYRDGEEIGRSVLRSARGDLRLVADVDRPDITADDRDLAFVTISLVDAEGTVHSGADRSIEVTVEGEGVLQGLGSARPDSEESFLEPRCTTFRGTALAVIRPTGAGSINVRVDAEGLPPAVATITANVD